ncbi:MAG: DUF1211 domain-containing protein [Candidatus Eremiobacteraeota bacterium]|nr:DUF1211 domain-containing protein [Candidatus Eremiobacteraeota bacterium]
MTKHRLEAFSDGVLAILITIMVLELHVPHGTDLHALAAAVPSLLLYSLSFAFLGIYWNNHHHMLYASERIDGSVLWANLHLLFWLSLVPFATEWVGANGAARIPTATYGVVLLLAAGAYTMLQARLLRLQRPDSPLRAAVRRDVKGKASILLYALATVAAFVQPWIADALFVIVALMWLVPDPRIERRVAARARPSS